MTTAKKPTAITPAVEQLISEALAIEAESAQDAGALGFMARAMVQARGRGQGGDKASR